jgi:LysR family transcriptional activator of nhaA
MTELAAHTLDLVIAEAPSGTDVSVKVFNHLLGETSISVFAVRALAERYRADFPASLDGAPFLIPASTTVVRRTLDHWLEARGIRPNVVGEFDDSALLNVFGMYGRGLFVAATAIEKEVCQQYGADVVGRLDEVRTRFYAISVERRIKNAAVRVITETARKALFVGA